MTIRTLRFTEDGHYALCQHNGDEGDIYVHPVEWRDINAYVNPHGRWECTWAHLKHYNESVYVDRFPVKAGDRFSIVGYPPS